MKTNLIISPRTTRIFPGKTKQNLPEGYPQKMPVTIENYYAHTTEFTVSAYYDTTPIGNRTISLNPLDSTTLLILWTETSTWPKGTYNYTITINTLVHTLSLPITFKITILGDINGDDKVDIRDIATAALAFGTYLNHPRWNPDADITRDLKVDIHDLALIAKNFGKIN